MIHLAPKYKLVVHLQNTSWQPNFVTSPCNNYFVNSHYIPNILTITTLRTNWLNFSYFSQKTGIALDIKGTFFDQKVSILFLFLDKNICCVYSLEEPCRGTSNKYPNFHWASEKIFYLFVCVEVLRPSQPNGVMSSTVSLPNHTFTGQA